MFTKAQQDILDAAFARLGKPSPELQRNIDKIRAAKNKDELVQLYLRCQNIERPVVEAEVIGLIILSKLAELDPSLNVEASEREELSRQIPGLEPKQRQKPHPTYKSLQQMAYFHANRDKLQAQGINVDEWDNATIAAGKVLPKEVEPVIRDYRHLMTNQTPPKLPDSVSRIPNKREEADGPTKLTRGVTAKIIRAFIFFIGCWFFLWCTLGLYLAWNTSGTHPDTDLATIAEIITFISVVATLFRIPKIKS